MVLDGTSTVPSGVQNHRQASGRSTGRYVEDFQQNADVQVPVLSNSFSLHPGLAKQSD